MIGHILNVCENTFQLMQNFDITEENFVLWQENRWGENLWEVEWTPKITCSKKETIVLVGCCKCIKN